MRSVIGALAALPFLASCNISVHCTCDDARCAEICDAAAHEAHDAYVAAINANDLDAVMAMFTDDIVFMAAGAPVMIGKEEIGPWIEGYLAAFHTRWEKDVEEFAVNGDWAWERYAWRSFDTPHGGGETVTDTGWGFILYHRESDGVWRVARDGWGPDHS